MIRGAIAFALVLKIPYVGSPECEDPEECYTLEAYELAVSTTLLLVMATTLIFGTFMKLTQTFLIQDKQTQPISDNKSINNFEEIKDSLEEKNTITIPLKETPKEERKYSVYEEIVHPNLERSLSVLSGGMERRPSYLLPVGGAEPGSFATSGFVNWFINFDEHTIRPFMIRNYNIENIVM